MSRLPIILFAVLCLGCREFGSVTISPASVLPSSPFANAGVSSPSAAEPAPPTTRPSSYTSVPSPNPDPAADLPFPLCGDVHELEAPARWYRAGLSGGDVLTIRDWAQRQPGYVEIWVDRDLHDGWTSVAFSGDSTAREGDLSAKFPNARAVVIPFGESESHLKDLRSRAMTPLSNIGGRGVSTSVAITKGVVEADLSYLDPALLDVLAENFAGEPLCLTGQDARLKPIEGPQPTGGAGWRLLADEDGTGNIYRTAIAFDDASYAALWGKAGISADAPNVDFQSEVVMWFGAVHGSSCPRLRLDDVVVEPDRPLVHGKITELDYGMCTADAMPHSYVVGIDRSVLPRGPFAIQLDAEDPPGGVPEERTVIDVDLSAAGSTAEPSQIHEGGPIP